MIIKEPLGYTQGLLMFQTNQKNRPHDSIKKVKDMNFKGKDR